MISKTVILLRVKSLQKGAGRISVKGLRQLIHLIQHHHRIGDAAPLYSLHDPAGHGSDIGASVAAYLRLIPDSAQTDPDILPSSARAMLWPILVFACSGRAHKQQNRTRLSVFQLHGPPAAG